MSVLITCDLGLNASLDYDFYNSDPAMIDGKNNLEWRGGMLVALVGLQAVVQISIFLTLFLSMADTFLFRVGLLGVLIKKFRIVLILHPIYFTISMVHGSYRVQQLESVPFDKLWHNNSFILLSIFQKIISIPYYVFSFRATKKLGQSIFYDRNAWISMVRDHKDGQSPL